MGIFQISKHFKNLFNWFCNRSYPPAIFRALKTYRKISKDAKEEPFKPFWFIINSISVLSISAWISCIIPVKEGLITCTLTALAVLAGFLISLMIYTGHTQNIDRLTPIAAARALKSIRFLLRFQLKTFLIYLFTISNGLLWFFFTVGSAKFIIETLFISGMFCSLLFSAILPFQLYEIHDYILGEAVKKNKLKANRKIDDLIEDARKGR